MKIIEFDKSSMSKEDTTLQCVEVADSTLFPTNYDDVYAHLFENDDLLKLFVVGDSDKIKGFSVFDTVRNNYNIMYLSGLVLGREIQGKGISKLLIREGLKLLKPEIITLRTRNPRMYQALVGSTLSYGSYPDDTVPNEIYNLALTIPYFNGIQSNLVIKDCYNEELIQQDVSVRNPVFKLLDSRDAFGCISIVNNDGDNVKRLIKDIRSGIDNK